MSGRSQRSYRFRTSAQWSACLFDRVDLDAKQGIQLIAPFEQSAELYSSSGAHAPAVTPAGEALWHDDAGCVHQLTACDDEPSLSTAPHAIAQATRIVSMSNGLWVISSSRTSLERYEYETLSRLAVIEIPASPIIDLAGDGRDQLFVLIEKDGTAQALHLDCSGHVVDTVAFEGITGATAFTFLRRSQRFVVMTGGECPRLYWFGAKGGRALKNVAIGALHPCFVASALGGDGRDRVFLAGADSADLGGRPFVLVFNGDGESAGEIPLDARDAPVTGATGTREMLLVTGPRGLLRYAVAKAVPDGTSEVRCSLMTPVLYSPDREDARRWLRVEAHADLPGGASLEIRYAATADTQIRDKLKAIAADESVPVSVRMQRLLREPEIWSEPITFHGGLQRARGPSSPNRPAIEGFASGESNAPHPEPLSAPLFGVHDPYVLIYVTLSATAGGSLPSLSELAVLYPGQSLMEHLPAIYRREETQPRTFLRSLVGVLESTTQGLDARIGSLASHIHPETASGPWLNFVARWLGVPWDDALSEEQKKRLIARAADIARGRGTRAGLETLLGALLPGATPRFRITDATADLGFATVGGDDCRGSTLPAMLGGSSRWRSELDANTVLGRMRLPCAGQVDDGVRALAGLVRVDIAATAEERQAWQAWLPALIDEMVPLTARVQLRWLGPQALRGTRLDGSLVLQGAITPHLGSDAVTGAARLPERGSRITSTGADIGTRLQ